MPIFPIRDADYFFTVTVFELEALERYRMLMESGLPGIAASGPPPFPLGEPETVGALAASGIRGSSISLEIQKEWMWEATSELLSIIFRSSFCLSLYSVYESAIVEIARSLHRRFRLPASVPSWRNAFLKNSRNYYRLKFNIDLFREPTDIEERLTALLHVRNALIHGNGRKAVVRTDAWEALAPDATRYGFSLHRNFIDLEERFVSEMLFAVKTALLSVISQARELLDLAGSRPGTSQA